MNLLIRAWATPTGQYICQVITLGNHVWKGWTHAGYRPADQPNGQPSILPMAYCARCGREF